MKSRIELTDTPISMLSKLADGNPGAATAMVMLIKETKVIDPDAALGQYTNMLILDSFQIYGSRIWMLYKDVCNQDITSMIAVLRALQLGKISKSIVDHAIDNYGKGIDTEKILAMVQKELPNFGKKETK